MFSGERGCHRCPAAWSSAGNSVDMPSAPTVVAVPGTAGNLLVTWEAPDGPRAVPSTRWTTVRRCYRQRGVRAMGVRYARGASSGRICRSCSWRRMPSTRRGSGRTMAGRIDGVNDSAPPWSKPLTWSSMGVRADRGASAVQRAAGDACAQVDPTTSWKAKVRCATSWFPSCATPSNGRVSRMGS